MNKSEADATSRGQPFKARSYMSKLASPMSFRIRRIKTFSLATQCFVCAGTTISDRPEHDIQQNLSSPDCGIAI